MQDGRYRKDLAAGHLRTELWINGRRLDDLNRHVALRAHPDNPQRLRIAVPNAFLKAGDNTLELRQRPDRNDPQQFDDCEISRLGLEVEP
ncbi:MAG: hypothetical protein EXS05_19970 [Planctomycetaceae bacterium]|nr:hypothetical protein [Planctomycetaceae bacterium]